MTSLQLALRGTSKLVPDLPTSLASALGPEAALIDALPYIDREFENVPGAREAALGLVEEECRRYRPTKNYLEHLGTVDLTKFETDAMRAEFDRLAARQPAEVLSMKRYELPAPAAGQKNDISAWIEAVDNSFSQLEHQSNRIDNLDLLEKYGANSWREYNRLLTTMMESAQKELFGLKRDLQETNWQRKSNQLDVSAELESAQQEWTSLVQKNFDIEAACLKLQKDVDQLTSEFGSLAPLKPAPDRKRKVLEQRAQESSEQSQPMESEESQPQAKVDSTETTDTPITPPDSDNENQPPAKVAKPDDEQMNE